jgi:hypothetical protein
MIDIVLSAGVFESVRPDGSPALRAALMSGVAELVLPGVVKWVPLSVRTVWTLWGTASISRRRKSPTVWRTTFSCSSTMANFDVQSIATSR